MGGGRGTCYGNYTYPTGTAAIPIRWPVLLFFAGNSTDEYEKGPFSTAR
jgi:hypothetical protein